MKDDQEPEESGRHHKTVDELAMDSAELVFDQYINCQTIQEAEVLLTTEELIRMVHNIWPDRKLEMELFVAALETKGFQYDLIGPGHLRWLLKPRS